MATSGFMKHPISVSINRQQLRLSMNDIRAIVGVDIAKHVFQLHEVSKETGEISSVQLKRKTFLAHFSNRSTCPIGMEAYGGAQHWARKLVAFATT
jgi:hypothetical protein